MPVNRGAMISVRLTEVELADLRAKAEAAGVSVSDILRGNIRGDRIAVALEQLGERLDNLEDNLRVMSHRLREESDERRRRS